MRSFRPSWGSPIQLRFSSTFPRVISECEFKHLSASESRNLEALSPASRRAHLILAHLKRLTRLLKTKHPLVRNLTVLIFPPFLSDPSLLPPSLSSTVLDLFSLLHTLRTDLYFEDRDLVISRTIAELVQEGGGRRLRNIEWLEPWEKEGVMRDWDKAVRGWERGNRDEEEGERAL
ncbi:hypothetical protein JCM8547_001264 [Rhodosporidiobolus lusitaniae]